MMNSFYSLVAVVLCRALAFVEVGPPAPVPTMSPNQAVAIDDTTEATTSLAAAKGDGVGEETSVHMQTETDELRPLVSPTKAIESNDSSRVMRRGVALLDGTVVANEKQMPWYRTGWGALVVVLSLMGLLVGLARRFLPTARISESGVLRVVSRSALSTKHSVALIQFGRRFLLLGMGPEGIQCLSEVSDSAEVADLLVRLSTAGGATRKLVQSEFDEHLRAESDEYLETTLESHSAVDHPSKGNSERRKPLHDLLNRLQQLQTKFSSDDAVRSS